MELAQLVDPRTDTPLPRPARPGARHGGTRGEVRAILAAELEALAKTQYVAAYYLAHVHTGLGEREAALDCLERALEERSGAIYGIKGSFLFASLRDHPRFQALLEADEPLTLPRPGLGVSRQVEDEKLRFALRRLEREIRLVRGRGAVSGRELAAVHVDRPRAAPVPRGTVLSESANDVCAPFSRT